MNHSVNTRKYIHKCTKIFNANNFTFVNLADFWLLNQTLNPIHSLFNRRAVWASHSNQTIFLNVNLSTSFRSDLIDRLATLTNNHANLIWVNLNLLNSWRIRTERLTRLRKHAKHMFQNVRTPRFTLLNCLTQYRHWQAMNLHIHLKSRNTL